MRAPTPRGARPTRSAAEDVAINHAIGVHGLALLRGDRRARKPGPVNVMTHCNAGALATCGWGTATAPVFLAHADGLPLHVWVSETRPRLQGASLTAWELAAARRPAHAASPTARARLLMRRGDVDIVLVGADRVAANGDVCNKIGTYDKALAARDNGVPFYVALPSPTLDPRSPTARAIPIETRAADEVLAHRRPRRATGRRRRWRSRRTGTRAVNYAFDVTPARLVTGLITERGIAAAGRDALAALVSGALSMSAADRRTGTVRWRRRRRDGAASERAGHQPRQVRQRERALSRTTASTAT